MKENPLILAIESSCDETSASVLKGPVVLSNIIANQKVHEAYGGVVPELASRAHQMHIVPVVQQALSEAHADLNSISAVAVTQGPGLMGSLHVGFAFAKSLAMSLDVPLLPVHHMQAHVLAHFIAPADREKAEWSPPTFPFLCLTVSGGHTQIVKVEEGCKLSIVGETLDDAAGEAFDKAAKVLGLPYPGGPVVDKLAAQGNAWHVQFPIPRVPLFNYSFSGLKTSLLYHLRESVKKDAHYIESYRADLCASFQKAIVDYLLQVFEQAARSEGVSELALAGGVSANSELRKRFAQLCTDNNWRGHVPPFQYCTDNAAMIGIAAYMNYRAGSFTQHSTAPSASLPWQ